MPLDYNPHQAFELIGHKWTFLIVCALSEGKRRYSELQRSLVGISQKMLTQTLRGLERDGIVARKIHPVIPPKVDYFLTPLGESLRGPVKEVRVWVMAHEEEMAAARKAYEAAATTSDDRGNEPA